MLQRLRQSLFRNTGIKLASLLLALVVYTHVYSIQERAAVLQVPLSVEGLPAGLSFRGEIPSEIRVRFRGRGGELLKLRSDPPRAVVRLAQPRVGQLERPVTTADVQLPGKSDATVEAVVDPVVLSITIEPIRKVALPIAVSVRGTPAAGSVRYGANHVWPETLTVTGPAGLIAAMDSIRTEAVDLDGRSQTVRETVRLRLPDGLRSRLDHVAIRVPIVPVMRRNFGPLSVTLPPELRGQWAILPDSVRVMLAGPKPLLEALSAQDVRPRALPSLPTDAEDVVPVQVGLPQAYRAGVLVEAVDPPTVVLVRPRRAAG